MDKQKIITLLEGKGEATDIEKYAAYCVKLSLAKKKDGSFANPWIQKIPESTLANWFERVAATGLVLDGEHITLQSTGITYDYIAYKNLMYIKYPESIIDVSLVFKDDTFSFSKKSGQVIYSHEIASPFNQKDIDVIGAYAVIKNKRGEFITLLSGEDLVKHRKVAKQDYIWAQWFKEMCLKTVIKKSCKQHFADIYQEVETIDNDNYDIENPIDIDLVDKQAIEAIKTLEELRAFYAKNTGKGKGFDKLIADKNRELTKQNENL